MGQKITKGKAKFRRSPQLSSKRKKLFLLITFLLPFVILALLETGLRIFDYGGNTSLFVSTPNETSKFYGINLNVAKRYFTKLSDVPTPRKDLFLKVKPANGYRIFVLGGSTTAGFPYGNNVTFTRILNRRLSDTFPDKYIEVVNTAMTAINTYTQLDFMDEILKYQPDAILIYSGHNEYYGALGVGSMESFGKSRWMVKATLSLQKFKIYLLMRDFVTWIKSLFGNSETDENLDPSATMMERIVKEDIIPLNSEDYETGKNQFKENIKEIIEKAKDAGVKVILSELISNVRDNKPFESVESKAYPSANKEFELAEEYEKEGKYDEARKAYYFAKDLDPLRFRAPEDFNKIIHDLGREYNVPVVPMESYFESASPHELIGNGLIFEHLHPNIKGYFLMADAFFDVMQKEKFISPVWNTKNIKPSSYYRSNWGFTPLDSMYAFLSVAELKGGWPFKKLHGPNRALLNYQPSNKIDSVALSVVSQKITLEMGHINLANYYEQKGEHGLAFNEFNSLIYTVPYLDLFYEPAVKILIGMERYDKAFEVLSELLKYQQIPFAYQWIGQIYLVKNETAKGIDYLKKAIELGSQDLALIFNLGRAYYKTSQFEKGDAVLRQLQIKLRGSNYISKLEEFRKLSIDNFKKASIYIKKAESYLKSKDYDNAYVVLQQSLKIQETSLANELIGMLDLMSGNKTDALSHLETAKNISKAVGPKLLYNLSNAYYVNAEYKKAKVTFGQLKKSYPDFPDPGNLESKLNNFKE